MPLGVKVRMKKMGGSGSAELKDHFFPEKSDEEWTEFIKIWSELDVKNVPFFGGIIYLARQLTNKDITLGVLTHRMFDNAVALLDRHDLLQFIETEHVQGGDSYKYDKSHGSKVFNHIFRRLRAKEVDVSKAGSVLFLGDSATDVRCSRDKRAIRFIGVTTGSLSKKGFIDEGVPSGDIIHAAYALPDWIERECPNDQ
jgi:phosphoglycolate phosphatase-like HAD superfamily hydrolase